MWEPMLISVLNMELKHVRHMALSSSKPTTLKLSRPSPEPQTTQFPDKDWLAG